MIEVEGLGKSFGERAALDDVTFSVESGEVVGLLGVNGAGKTTCLRILSGWLEADRGGVRIDGIRQGEGALDARRRIGYLPENNPLYPEMRVDEYLAFRAGLKGARGRDRRSEVKRVLRRCSLETDARRLVGTLSRGVRQRVGIADALLGSPGLLVLDEPAQGLDPNQVVALRELIAELRGAHTLIVSTHVLGEVEQVCDRALVLHDGRLVGEESFRPGGLARGSRILVELRGHDVPRMENALSAAGRRVAEEPLEDSWVLLTLDCDDDAREAIGAAALRAGVPLRRLERRRLSLEDRFRRLTLGESR